MGSQIGALFGGLFGDAGANFADLQGGADAVFGKKPGVADYTPIDLAAEQKKAIDANIGSSGDIDNLLEQAIPGYKDMLTTGTGNALSELKGEIPQDVQDTIKRSDAFKSLSGGFAGSGMSRALTARDLGLTSLDMVNRGENSAQLWSRLATGVRAPFELNPMQQAGVTTENNRANQATQQFKFNVAAAPDPGALGIFNVDAALGQQMLSLGGSLGGMGMGGGGGGAQIKATGTDYGSAAAIMGQQPSGGNWWDNASSNNSSWSDERLKDNIVTVGKSPAGHRIVEFEYLSAPEKRYRGVIAQEVRKINPDAVVQHGSGYLSVNYDMIDVPFEEVA